jgi:hypothetical protein
VVTEQALVFLDDQRPDWVALAMSLLQGDPVTGQSYSRLLIATPGFDESADNGDGTIDQSAISDGDLLSATQAEYPRMVGLFYDAEGNRLPGTGGPT